MRSSVQANNQLAAQMAAEVVSRELENCGGIAEAVSRSPSLIDALEHHDEKAVRSAMEIIVESYPRIDRASVLDKEGVLWADYPSAPETYRQNFAGRDHFQGVVRQRETPGFKGYVPYISEVFRRVAFPRPLVVTASTAIHDREENLLGVIVCQYRLETLTDWLKDCDVGDSGYVYVLDKRGRVAAHPRIDVQATQHAEYACLPPVQAAQAGHASTGEYEDPIALRTMVATFWPVKISGNNWVVVAQQPEADAYAPIRSARMQFALVTGLLALAAVAVIVAMGRIQRQLREAKEAAEAASRAKSAFLANMSHEIRTPLTAIMGIADLLMRRRPSPQQRGFLQTMREAGDALLSLIDDILDFSKIEAERIDLAHEPFDLWESLGRTMNSFAVRAQERKLNLSYAIRGNVPRTVVGDYHRLRQVILNLVGNALKFTELGEVSLEVAVASWTDGGVVLRFTVRDTGVGIPPEKQSSIFEMFEQADNSITRRYGGTGLGLAIVSRLLKRMGGRIWVESEVGRGSRFHFLLPLELAVVDAEATSDSTDEPQVFAVEIPAEDAPAERRAASAEETPQDGRRILLAEDSLVNQRLAVALLEEEGYAVQVTTNGRAALAAAQEGGFDAILMDIQMPEMDGLEATRRIRLWEKGTGRRVPIIAMTAHAIQGDRENCLEAGMDGYVSKPISPDDLLGALRSLFPRGGAAS